MALSCGLIGIAASGKTVIFKAITSSRILSSNPSDMNRMIIKVPDSRLDKLTEMYHPCKTIATTIEIVDIPGLSTHVQPDGKGFRLLGHIKNVDALIHVVRCFEDGNIPFEYDEMVEKILNKDGTDTCPFEKIALPSKSPEETYRKIKSFLKL